MQTYRQQTWIPTKVVDTVRGKTKFSGGKEEEN